MGSDADSAEAGSDAGSAAEVVNEGLDRCARCVVTFFFFFQRSSSPKALHMLSLTKPLRNFKPTDLCLSRFMAVSRGIVFYC